MSQSRVVVATLCSVAHSCIFAAKYILVCFSDNINTPQPPPHTPLAHGGSGAPTFLHSSETRRADGCNNVVWFQLGSQVEGIRRFVEAPYGALCMSCPVYLGLKIDLARVCCRVCQFRRVMVFLESRRPYLWLVSMCVHNALGKRTSQCVSPRPRKGCFRFIACTPNSRIVVEDSAQSKQKVPHANPYPISVVFVLGVPRFFFHGHPACVRFAVASIKLCPVSKGMGRRYTYDVGKQLNAAPCTLAFL